MGAIDKLILLYASSDCGYWIAEKYRKEFTKTSTNKTFLRQRAFWNC